MLDEFLTTNRKTILARTRAKSAWCPSLPAGDRERGVPGSLDNLVDLLGHSSASWTSDGASLHGASLLREGFSISQVVHVYRDVRDAVEEIATETNSPIPVDELCAFNRCLDDAMDYAVTEYTRGREQSIASQGVQRLGELAHEIRNALGAATLSFEVLRARKAGVDGSTGAVLGRSLRNIAHLVDVSLSEVRLGAELRAPAAVAVRELVEEIAVSASMGASGRAVQFTHVAGDAEPHVHVDRQLLAAAISNLLQNAFKFTRPGSRVSLNASATDARVLIDIEDECGGLPAGKAADLFRPFEQRSADRTGLGLGLSISRKSVEASGGLLRVQDLPGTGCVFTVDLPRLQA